jgi:hypothetical protein
MREFPDLYVIAFVKLSSKEMLILGGGAAGSPLFHL